MTKTMTRQDRISTEQKRRFAAVLASDKAACLNELEVLVKRVRALATSGDVAEVQALQTGGHRAEKHWKALFDPSSGLLRRLRHEATEAGKDVDHAIELEHKAALDAAAAARAAEEQEAKDRADAGRIAALLKRFGKGTKGAA